MPKFRNFILPLLGLIIGIILVTLGFFMLFV